MNEKMIAILLQIVVELKKEGWTANKDWEITLKGEGRVPLTKQIPVRGILGDKKWLTNVETYVDLKLRSDDNITYFPEYTIYAHIALEGAESKDLAYKMEGTAAFTEADVKKRTKMANAAKQLDRIIEVYINHEYQDYLDVNKSQLNIFKMAPSSVSKTTELPRRRNVPPEI